MSWDCKDCDETHPGRFAFCPVSGRARAVADTLAAPNTMERLAELKSELEHRLENHGDHGLGEYAVGVLETLIGGKRR